MSLHIKLRLKVPSTSIDLNKAIEEQFGEQIVYFANSESNQAWLDDINTNKKSDCAHLKPKDRELTMSELKSYFSQYTEEGMANVDIGFGRTPELEMQSILAFIDENRGIWQEIHNIHDLVERSDSGNKYKHLLFLDHYFPEATYGIPKDHPSYKAVHDSGCVAYISGMNDSVLGVVYGNVDSPTFLKASTTIDPTESPLIKDSEGRNILMVPLIPMDERAQSVALEAYNDCLELYIQEPMGLFMAKIYPQIKPSDGYDIGADEAVKTLEVSKRKCAQSERYSKFNCDESILEYADKRYSVGKLSSRATVLAKKAGVSMDAVWWFFYAIASLRAKKNGTSGEIAQLYHSIKV